MTDYERMYLAYEKQMKRAEIVYESQVKRAERAEARAKELEQDNVRLKNKLHNIWHIANCYDGNYAMACSSIMDVASDDH